MFPLPYQDHVEMPSLLVGSGCVEMCVAVFGVSSRPALSKLIDFYVTISLLWVIGYACLCHMVGKSIWIILCFYASYAHQSFKSLILQTYRNSRSSLHAFMVM